MNKLMRVLFIAISAICLCSPVVARNIDHVNVGRITVSDQSLRSQQKAGKQALAQVFVKLSGNPEVLKSPAIERAVDNYEQFLTASSFLQTKEQLIFEAQFNRQKVENLLMASGLSVWASLRPSGILWLATKTPNNITQVLFQNQALMQQSSAYLANTISLQAYARGIDIVLPIGDLQDTSNVSVYDVWNQFISVLQRQSQRYATDYLISATLQAYTPEDHELALAQQTILQQEYDVLNQSNRAGNSVDVSSEGSTLNEDNTEFSEDTPQLDNTSQEQGFVADIVSDLEGDTAAINTDTMDTEFNNNPQVLVSNIQASIPANTSHKIDYVITNRKMVVTGTIYGSSQENATQKLVDVYTNMLAKQFALSDNSDELHNEPIILQIGNIDSLADYVALVNLIESVPAISKIQLVKQHNKQSTFTIEQSISIDQLRSILSLDPRLGIENTIQSEQYLQFTWQE